MSDIAGHTLNWDLNDPIMGMILLNGDSELQDTDKPFLAEHFDFLSLWMKAKWVVCADGAANRLINSIYFPQKNTILSNSICKRERGIPDFIVGDFDSVGSDVLTYFSSQGSRVEASDDQDSTDLQKCLCFLENLLEKDSIEQSMTKPKVLLVGGLGRSRFDHTLSMIHTLHLFSAKFQLILLDGPSACFLLSSDLYSEHIVNLADIFTRRDVGSIATLYCGLVPTCGKSVISTKGLKWDVSDWETNMYGNVSTSNIAINDLVRVSVRQGPVLWTCSLHK